MSYKEKPILKLYKYENNSFVLQAQIDDYQEVSWENNLYEAGQFSITINYNIPNASLFERGLFINFGDSYEFGEILKIQDSIGEDGAGSQLRVITGYDARYILKRRVIKNMNNNGLWTMTGKGELVIRNLIADQAGANAEEKRRLPIVNTIPSEEDAIGKEYSASEQFSNLYEVCKTIATQSEVGWRIEFDGTSLTLVFFSGEDRSQVVRFDTSYESLANGTFVDSGEAFSNAIYVGGKGQNDDRDIYEGENAIEGNAPSGLDRFECWDNQSSMTTEDEYEAEALAMLTQYGQTITLSGNGLAKCPYEYEKEYNVGDKITVAFSGKSAVVQILSVTEHWAFASYDLNFSFGKPQPDLNGQLQLILKQIQKASNKTNSKDSVRWYTIPTDTEMPASDVTYTHIGFIGDVGNDGKTFTLYRDTSGTGSKTYHVYFKQLGGSGKLTLTTGVSGASNLVLNPGTYVIIIYVDENGNITSQGMTPTSTIESGNNRPAESGAVNTALEQEIENRNSAITNAINSLDVPSVGGSGKYISAISETDGKISATASDVTSTVSSGNSQPVTSGGVYDDSFLLREEVNNDIDNYPIDGVRAYRVTGKTIGWVSDDGFVINIPWATANFGAQIAVDDQSNWLAIRTKNRGVWGNWDRLVKSSEINAENNDDGLVNITSQITDLRLGITNVYAYKKNNMVYLRIQGTYTGNQTSSTQRLLGELPQKYRPKVEEQFAVGLAYNSVAPNVYPARLVVYSDGHIDMAESAFPNGSQIRTGILYMSN